MSKKIKISSCTVDVCSHSNTICAQQPNSFLQHATFYCSYLSAVVEVSVGVELQLLHLLHLIQHLVHVELGHEEFQTAVSVSLPAEDEKLVYIIPPNTHTLT